MKPILKLFSAIKISSLYKDIGNTLSVNSFSFVLSLVNNILLARLLGAAGRGEYAVILLWPGFIGHIIGVGVGQAVVFYSGKNKENIEAVISSLICIAIVQSILVISIGWIIIPMVITNYGSHVISLAQIMLLQYPLAILITYQLSIFQGTSRFDSFNKLRLYNMLTYSTGIVVILGILKASSLSALVGLQFFNSLILVLFGSYFLRKNFKGVSISFKAPLHLIKKIIAYGLKAHLGNITWLLNSRLDQLVISIFLTSEQLGWYALAVNIASSPFTLSGALANITYGKISASDDATGSIDTLKKIIGINALVIIPICLAGIVLMPVIIPWLFGMEFKAAILPANILLIGTIALGFNYIFQDGLRGWGLPVKASLTEFIGVIVTIVLLLLLLPKFRIAGAAIASTVSYYFTFMVSIYFISRAMNISLREFFDMPVNLFKRII